jgi:hypothetical protein
MRPRREVLWMDVWPRVKYDDPVCGEKLFAPAE